MHDQKGTKFRNIYRILFWLMLGLFVLRYIVSVLGSDLADADELVVRQEIHNQAWVYVTRYGAPATDLDTLRFYLTEEISGSDADILRRLNRKSPFMITDSHSADVVIRDVPEGVFVAVKGAVYRYYSKQSIDGVYFKSYRISLSQRDR